MDALFLILLLTAEFAFSAIVWKIEDDFSPTTALVFVLAVVITFALFVAFGDLSELDYQVTP
jgi:amino acid transporter